MSRKRKLSDSDSDLIINEVKEEFKETSSVKSKFMGTNKSYHYNKIPHHLLPEFNYCKYEESDVFLEDEPNFQIGPPLSVYVTDNFIPKVDICCKRTTSLTNYMIHLKRLRTFYITSRKKNRILRKAEKKNVYPRSLINFVEKIDQHPDPYFNARYDFYYTGGNLSVLSKNNYVVHSSGEYLETLNVSKLHIQNNIPTIELQASLSLHESENEINEIFEIQPIKNCSKIIFKTRCQHKILIHNFSENKIKLLSELTSDVPFISFAQNKCNSNILITSDLKQEIRIWDLEASKKAIRKINFNRSKTINRNWNSIKAYSKYTYIYAGLNELCLWDTRVPIKEIKNNFCIFNDPNEKCANISSLVVSKFKNLFYVGSTHKLRCLDVRFMKKELTGGENIVLEWTHQMELPPLMMKTSKNMKNENIFLASARAGDIRVCKINRNMTIDGSSFHTNIDVSDQKNEYSYSSNSLPSMPPTNIDGYKQAKIQGKCLNPALQIKERINRCNTGLSVYSNDNDVFLLVANSIGDIFAHKISYSSTKDINFTTPFIEHYEKNIENLNIKEPIQLTTVANLSPIREVLNFNDMTTVNPLSSIKSELSEAKRKRCWQKPIQILSTYKDALASDILAIWDIDFKTEQNVTLQETLSNTNLVSNWLNNYSLPKLSESLIDTKPSTAILNENNSPNLKMQLNGFAFETNLNSTINATLLENSSTNLNNITLNEIINSSSADHTNIDFISQKSTAKLNARNRYVKGF